MANFSTNLDFSPTKIPQNQPIFPRILTFFQRKSCEIGRFFRVFAPENPAKFCFFLRKISEALLKRRLSNHNDIWKQKILKLFCKQANKSQDLTMQPLKTFQCNYSNCGTWKQSIPPRCFLKTKILKLFYNRTNKTQGSTMQPLKTLILFELTWHLR